VWDTKLVNKEQEFKSYILWKSIPSTLYGKDDKTLEALGITDETTKELAQIRSQTQFAEKFKIAEVATLTDWNKKIKDNNLLIHPREWFKDKVKNVALALYRQSLIEGDAARSKLFFQYVEDWKEKTEQEIKSPELKEIADELKRLAMKKNDEGGSQTTSPQVL
jgi:hypothetical protein